MLSPKIKPILCAVLVGALLFAFCVSSLGAFDDAPNLIDPSEWSYEIWLPSGAEIHYTYFPNSDIVRFWSTGASEGFLGIVFSNTTFIPGHSYQASFTLEKLNYGFFEGDALTFGIHDSLSLDESFQSYQIDGADFVEGRTYTYSFTGESYSNPVFGFGFAVGHGVDFRLQNVRLVDITAYESDEQTNKIGGFFDDLFQKIEDFFTGFLNLILYFNAEGEYTNPFTFGSVGDLSEHLATLTEGVSSFADSLADFISPVTAVCLVLDEIAESLPVIKILVPVLLMGLVLVRLLGI